MNKKNVVVLCSEPEWGGEHQYDLTLMECMIKIDDDIDVMAVCSNHYWRKWC